MQSNGESGAHTPLSEQAPRLARLLVFRILYRILKLPGSYSRACSDIASAEFKRMLVQRAGTDERPLLSAPQLAMLFKKVV